MVIEGWWLISWGLGALFVVSFLGFGHFFKWARKLSRIQAYTYGVSVLWFGFVVWRLLNGDWQAPAGFLLMAGVGGLTVKACYWWDGVVKEIKKASKAEAADDDLAE